MEDNSTEDFMKIRLSKNLPSFSLVLWLRKNTAGLFAEKEQSNEKRYLQTSNNSSQPADWARELFKPSTDATSFLL